MASPQSQEALLHIRQSLELHSRPCVAVLDSLVLQPLQDLDYRTKADQEGQGNPDFSRPPCPTTVKGPPPRRRS